MSKDLISAFSSELPHTARAVTEEEWVSYTRLLKLSRETHGSFYKFFETNGPNKHLVGYARISDGSKFLEVSH